MPRVLITGGSGFVGQWLSRALLERGWSVFGGTVTGTPEAGVLTREQLAAVQWLELDMLSERDIDAALATSDPEWVVHLAGIASPPEANASPVRAFDTNALGALRLLGALGRENGDGSSRRRILVIGSAEQYGPHPAEEQPLSESASLLPLTTYGASKAAQETIALQFFRGSGAPVICTRSFNHSGAGHGPTYLLPALVGRARSLPRTGGVLRIGNGSPVRDYLHVSDVVRAYLLLLERGKPGEVYNISSGNGIMITDLAKRVLKRAGVTADISNDPALTRPVETPILVGNNSKLRAATGWTPERTIDDIIDDLLHAAPR
jgi:GDP-4-dehydro-6-deoxy-D-mannose reductase